MVTHLLAAAETADFLACSGRGDPSGGITAIVAMAALVGVWTTVLLASQRTKPTATPAKRHAFDEPPQD